jgi:DNA invertase Pin-like site-specific DNA recombinase
VKLFEDKISSRKADCPGLTGALDYLRPGDELAVWKLDCLGRSVKEVLTLVDELHERGVRLRILTGHLAGTYTPTGEGKFFFTIMAALDVISSSPDDQDSDLGCNVADGVFDLAA